MCDIFYARTADGPVSASDPPAFYNGKALTCYECGNPLHRKKQHKRKRNGIVYDVREHFAHNPGSSCSGTAESVEHKAAKHVVVKMAKEWRFQGQCSDCRRAIPVEIARPEHNLETEVSWMDGKYRLDVAVIDPSTAKVVGAVEVLHKHAFDETKAGDMTDGGLAWCEVKASDVLEFQHLEGAVVMCTRVATPWCVECGDKRKRRLEKEADARIERALDSLRRQRVQTIQRNAKEALYNKKLAEIEEATGEKMSELSRQALLTAFDNDAFGPDSFLCVDAAVMKHLTPRFSREKATAEAKRHWAKVARQLEAAADKTAASDEFVRLADLVSQWVVEHGGGVDAADRIDDLAHADHNDILTFGKHAGKTIQRAFVDDPGYVVWLAGWTGYRDGDNQPELRRNVGITRHIDTARKLLEGTCLLCHADTGKDWKHWCRTCYKMSEK